MRRCQAYEKTNKIEEALADAKKVQELDPSYPKVINIIILFSSINSFIHSFIIIIIIIITNIIDK